MSILDNTFLVSPAALVHHQHLSGGVHDAGVCGVGTFFVVLIRGVQAGFGSQRAVILLHADALLLGGSGGEDGGATEHGAAGGCGGERRHVLSRRTKLVLLLQGHGIPQSHVVVHEGAGLAACQRVA